MIILGIDTSCDDTCVSLLKIKNPKTKIKKFEIVSNIVSSQAKLHLKYGGVYPFLAKREHQKNLPIVFKKAIQQTQGKLPKQSLKIDLVAVTTGPGLEPCLWQGVNFAKKLAEDLKLQIIPVNHIEAHILANWLSPVRSKSKIKNQKSKIIFPAVCLVVSGGHTQLILMEKIGRYKLIGETRDDAAGECFDKVARILRLGYPGGPAIAATATNLKPKTYNLKPKLPRPMIYQKNYDFSFAGLKTAVLYDFRNRPPKIRKSKEYIQAMCREIQQSIIDVLIHKTIKAAKDFKAKSIILGGGVAANEELRRQFKEAIERQLPNTLYLIPNISFCTDNAAMIAVTAYFHQKEATKNWQEIKVNANLKI